MKPHSMLFATVLTIAAAGCGGSDNSLFGGGSGSNGTLGGGGNSGPLGGTNPGGGVSNACATDHAAAGLAPSYLAFIMDRSDSMSQQSKWPSCSAALGAFFNDPTTQGLSASLTWLPYVPPGSQSTSNNPVFSCAPPDYASPAVAMTGLPNPAFGSAIQSQQLQYGTPTLPALQGTATYASQV